MTIFRDAEHFYDCVGELMDRAKIDNQVGLKIAKSKVVIQFQYTEPEAVTTINAKENPTQPGAHVDVIHGDCDLKPDITMSMKADVAHKFWLGKVNLVAAVAKKDVVVKGPMPKVLKLLPSIQPLFKIYPVLLKEKGYNDMLTS